MDNNTLVTIIGYAASICMVLGYTPQAFATIRTHRTDDIAMPTFIMLGLGSVLFVAQGIFLNNIPIIITNVVATVCSVIIFGIKIYNDHFKKKK